MPVRRSQPGLQRRRAAVLLAVLVVVGLLSLAAYRYNDWMSAEARAAVAAVRAAQARALADSGVHYAAALLADSGNSTLNNNPYDNPSAFQDISVPGAARGGRFSVVSPPAADEQGGAFRYG